MFDLGVSLSKKSSVKKRRKKSFSKAMRWRTLGMFLATLSASGIFLMHRRTCLPCRRFFRLFSLSIIFKSEVDKSVCKFKVERYRELGAWDRTVFIFQTTNGCRRRSEWWPSPSRPGKKKETFPSRPICSYQNRFRFSLNTVSFLHLFFNNIFFRPHSSPTLEKWQGSIRWDCFFAQLQPYHFGFWGTSTSKAFLIENFSQIYKKRAKSQLGGRRRNWRGSWTVPMRRPRNSKWVLVIFPPKRWFQIRKTDLEDVAVTEEEVQAVVQELATNSDETHAFINLPLCKLFPVKGYKKRVQTIKETTSTKILIIYSCHSRIRPTFGVASSWYMICGGEASIWQPDCVSDVIISRMRVFPAKFIPGSWCSA